MRLTDSHCHPHLAPLDTHTDQVIANARACGVEYLLCVSVRLEDTPKLLALTASHERVYASIGVHPNEPPEKSPTESELVERAQHPSVIAIGETGLDYFRSEGDLGWQQERFRVHIQAARTINKPLIIHTRDAAVDTMRILAEEGAAAVGGVMHCFTESEDIARIALDLNFYISFSGIVTFRNAHALRAVAKMVPADRLLIETDSPYLAPAPYRGKTNEPALVQRVAEVLGEVRGVSVAAIAEQTTENFLKLFRVTH